MQAGEQAAGSIPNGSLLKFEQFRVAGPRRKVSAILPPEFREQI